MAKICPKCGNRMNDSANFCTVCGAPLGSVPNEAAVAVVPRKKSANKKTLGIIGAVAVVAVIAGAMGVSLGKNSSSTDNNHLTNVNAAAGSAVSEVIKGSAEEEPNPVPDTIGNEPVDTEQSGIESNSKSESATPPTKQKSTATSNKYIIPNSDIVMLTDNQLKNMDLSADELRLARNEIYARHGRRFTDESLQSYFDSCSWYHGTIAADDFDESVLSDIEKSNIESISYLEDEKNTNVPSDWYMSAPQFYSDDTGCYLDIHWYDDGTLCIALDGVITYYTSTSHCTKKDGFLTYECEDGTEFSYYPFHHGEVQLHPADGSWWYEGTYYPV